MNKNLIQKKAEKIQNEIFRKMPAEKKLKIAFEFFELGKKLNGLKKQKIDETRRNSFKNRKNSKKA